MSKTFSRLRAVFLSLISFGLVFAFVWYLYLNQDKYQNLFRTSPLLAGLLFTLIPLFFVVDAVITTDVFENFGVKISFRDAFLLSSVSSLANQLPISGGIISKGYYLKKKYGLAYSKFASTILGVFFCAMVVSGAVGFAVLTYWAIFWHINVPFLLFAVFFCMMSCVLVFWLPLEQIHLPEKITEKLSQALEGWLLISKSPLLILKLVGLQSTMLLLLAARYWLSFYMLSQNITPTQAILFSAASILTQLVSFAPGGLGVREAVVGGLALVLGFDMGVSIVAVGVDRLVSTLIIALIGGVGLIVLGKQISNFTENIDKPELL